MSQAQAKLCLHAHKSLQPRVKTWQLLPGAAGSLGWPWSSSIQSLPLPKVLLAKGCGPLLPTPFGILCTGISSSCHHQTTHPAGNFLLSFLFLSVGSNPLFVPGQFSSLSPIPHLFPGPVSVTPGWSHPPLRSILSLLCSQSLPHIPQGDGSPSQQDFGNEAGADQPSVILAGSCLAPARLWHTKQRVPLHRKAGIHLIKSRKIKRKPPSLPNPLHESTELQHPKAPGWSLFPSGEQATTGSRENPRTAINSVPEGIFFCSTTSHS